MNKIRIITDSASDFIDKAHGLRQVDIFLPLTINFDDKEYRDGVDIGHKDFYEMLIEVDVLPKTSQVPPAVFEDAMKEITDEGDTAIVITVAKELSGTYQSAVIAASEFDSDKVFIIDSGSASIGELALIHYAQALIDKFHSGEYNDDINAASKAIVSELENAKRRLCVVALLDTLEYLKKGGRISAAAAFAGGLLNIKPVIDLKDGVIHVLGKARGSKQGNNMLIQEINKFGGIDYSLPLLAGYTGLSDKLAEKYVDDSSALWEGHIERPLPVTIGGTIGTHVGPGAVAAAFFSPAD